MSSFSAEAIKPNGSRLPQLSASSSIRSAALSLPTSCKPRKACACSAALLSLEQSPAPTSIESPSTTSSSAPAKSCSATRSSTDFSLYPPAHHHEPKWGHHGATKLWPQPSLQVLPEQ